MHLTSKQVPLNYLSERLLHLATLTRGVNTKRIEAVKVGMANQNAPSEISHQLHAMALRPAWYFSFANAAAENQRSIELRKVFLKIAIWDISEAMRAASRSATVVSAALYPKRQPRQKTQARTRKPAVSHKE